MSLENHPNFHAVQFATDITTSFYDSLRGKAGKIKAIKLQKIVNEIPNFVLKIEEMIDKECEKE